MLARCFLFALLLAACQPESKPAAQKPVLRDANLALLDRLTPRLGKLTLADTTFENVQLVLVDSCASPLLSAGLAGWPRGCGAITVNWNYVRPVLLIGRLLEPQHLDAVLVPVVPEDGPVLPFRQAIRLADAQYPMDKCAISG
jgi:hypothetical protein